MSRMGLARIGAGVLVVLLCVSSLADVPALWFDEGSYLHVPQALVQRGVYADYSAGELRFGGPIISLGPTVLLPIAVSFKLFGVGVVQARGVMVAFLLLFLLTTWRFARELASERVADLTILLLVGAPAVNVLILGRQVLGEVPALWFVMLGLLTWQRALQGDTTWKYVVSGLAFGLAVVTKYQILITLVPGFGVAWAVTRWRGAWAPHRAFIVPLAVSAFVFGAWQTALFAYVGSDAFAANVSGIATASRGAAVVFAPAHIRDSLRTILGAGAYVGLVAPALTWVCVRALNTRDARSTTWVLVIGMSCANLAWFVVSSIGWPRYAVPGLALAGLSAAAMLDHFTRRVVDHDGSSAPALRAVGWVWIALAGPLPFIVTASTIFQPPVNSAQAMATFLDHSVSPTALIETWEPQFSVMADHQFRFPPNVFLAAAVAYRFSGGPPPSAAYDFTKPPPDYVLVGDFGAWVDVYPKERLMDGFTLLHEEGPYQLFQRRDLPVPRADHE